MPSQFLQCEQVQKNLIRRRVDDEEMLASLRDMISRSQFRGYSPSAHDRLVRLAVRHRRRCIRVPMQLVLISDGLLLVRHQCFDLVLTNMKSNHRLLFGEKPATQIKSQGHFAYERVDITNHGSLILSSSSSGKAFRCDCISRTLVK